MDIGAIVLSGLISIIFAVLTYLAVNKVGQWQERRMYSRLGVAIIESLQEEIGHGINTMKTTLQDAKNPAIQSPLISELPNLSWEGMSTIPDKVLLRIIETSKDKPHDGPYVLKDCRIHCKNYFKFICGNYTEFMHNIAGIAQNGGDWRTPCMHLLEMRHNLTYIQNAENVTKMLEQAKALLDKNSKALMPR